MSTHQPIPAHIRLAITSWPDDAPRGAVTTFCLDEGISRNTFYKIRSRAASEGTHAALSPHSTRPLSSPNSITTDVKTQAIHIRASMEREGLDFGPISVHDRMRQLGMDAPSTASLARIFRAAGVARNEPKKKPRASWNFFVYPNPNGCWQLDGTEYVLVGGKKCVILQLTDDHSRKAIASLAAPGETAEAAVEVFRIGVERYGIPQRLLTDNGSALNPARRGIVGALFLYVTELGVEAITGKPGKPTTQGKNERGHQTMARWLAHKPQARSLEELQALLDEFDVIYNTRRPHQGLPGRITPEESWNATPKATPPRPDPDYVAAVRAAWNKSHPATNEDTGIHRYKTDQGGGIRIRDVKYNLGRAHANSTVVVVPHEDGVIIATHDGTLITEHAWPPAGVKHVGNGQPPGRPRATVTDVLMQDLSPMS